MSFRKGDSVMHWTFGLGKVVRLEEREVSGKEIKHYAIQINDMTIWVPEDEMLETRLRPPTSKNDFKKLQKLLTRAGEALPDDRHQRKIILTEILKDGSAESLCRVVRSIATYRKNHTLNENDQMILRRAEKALIGEWGVVLSVTPLEAENEMRQLLSKN